MNEYYPDVKENGRYVQITALNYETFLISGD